MVTRSPRRSRILLFKSSRYAIGQQLELVRLADGSIQHVWTGDRWQSADDGIKAHDKQYWAVLDFVSIACSAEQGCVAGTIDLPAQLSWDDQIYITV
eukprot:m.566806 g.566806  ORF g.566806 m.566806 type:complete len:97 (-) comp22254_c0_seq5:388-678(-)